ncbi:MAG: glycoside hydrolase family 3 N-terminal domain-containing protein [Candidatus Thiodiazotropha sp.]
MKIVINLRDSVGLRVIRITYDLIALAFILVTGVWAFNFRNPLLMSIRDFEIPLYLFAVALVWTLSRIYSPSLLRRSSSWIIPVFAIYVVYSDYCYESAKQQILSDPSQQILALNRKFIVGYSDVTEVTKLAENGIAGIFLTQRNIKGETFESLQGFIAKLQEVRKAHGLPALIVATDQEGGPVSRLSPLIAKQETLARIHQKGESAFEYGKRQGESLRRLGVTVNFSPVVDLIPDFPPSGFDFHTLIGTRAISSNPLDVVEVSLEYIRGLESEGVVATLKHFPGLARVHEDTHYFAAVLDDSLDELGHRDLIPFARLATTTQSWVMLSHVTLAAVDSDHPVSTSYKVIHNLIKERLKMHNILITDDMTMGAIYHRGFCKSIKQSFESSVDYLLIAYDYEKYYDAIQCLEG